MTTRRFERDRKEATMMQEHLTERTESFKEWLKKHENERIAMEKRFQASHEALEALTEKMQDRLVQDRKESHEKLEHERKESQEKLERERKEFQEKLERDSKEFQQRLDEDRKTARATFYWLAGIFFTVLATGATIVATILLTNGG